MKAQFLEGGFAKHISQIVGHLEDGNLLLDADFVSDRETMRTTLAEDIGLDDELAERCGVFCLQLVAARCRRGLAWWRGWPGQMIGVLGSDEVQRDTLQSFKKDPEVWEQFQAYANKGQKMQLLERRSLFQETSAQQHVQALNLPEVLFGVGARHRRNH